MNAPRYSRFWYLIGFGLIGGSVIVALRDRAPGPGELPAQ